MTWEKEVAELNRRRILAKQQGGPEGVAKQHSYGRLTIRERIEILLDEDSFQEHGQATAIPDYDDDDNFLGFVPANYVLGFGRIDDRRVVVGGEDFTLKGGSPNSAGLRKSIYAEHLAVQYKVPLVRMLEGGGGSVKSSGKRRGGGGGGDSVFGEPRFKIIADAMGEVPVVSMAGGAVAGFPAGRMAASHFSVMSKTTAQILVAGPKVVERALGVDMTKDELGGAHIHAKSGLVDNVADDEESALLQCRQFLSYLPSSVYERTPKYESDDDVDRMEPDLLSAVPRDSKKVFNIREVIKMIVDKDSFFELGKDFGRSQVVGLARLDGQPVGVLANNNRVYAGAMTAEAAQKYRRFVELCDTFHVPVVNLIDQPGFMIGIEAEKKGTIRYGMAAVAAAAQATIPWVAIQVHKSFGVATAAHYAPNAYVLAWPSAESGALPLEGGVAVAYHREIEAAEDPIAKRNEIEERLRQARSPFPRAESFGVHELIDPRETRPALCRWVDWIQPQLDELKGPVRFGMRP